MDNQKFACDSRHLTYRLLDHSSKQIADTAKGHGSCVRHDSVRRKTIYTFTFNSYRQEIREQFEMRIHKRLLDILETTPKTVDALMRLDLPAGVDVKITLL